MIFQIEILIRYELERNKFTFISRIVLIIQTQLAMFMSRSKKTVRTKKTDALDTIRSVMSLAKPEGQTTFHQLRNNLGDNAAATIMEYFIDCDSLHQYGQLLTEQVNRMKMSDVDYHASVLYALLKATGSQQLSFRSESMFDEYFFTKLMPGQSDTVHVRPLSMRVDGMRVFPNNDTMNLGRAEYKCIEIFGAVFRLLATRYYDHFDVPYSVRRTIDLGMIIDFCYWHFTCVIFRSQCLLIPYRYKRLMDIASLYQQQVLSLSSN